YDSLPNPLRVQIVKILNDTMGDSSEYKTRHIIADAYDTVVAILCREFGVFKLTDDLGNRQNGYGELHGFILREHDVEKVLSAVELAFGVVDRSSRSFNYRVLRNAQELADDAIQELNVRFKEHGVGYEFTGG